MFYKYFMLKKDSTSKELELAYEAQRNSCYQNFLSYINNKIDLIDFLYSASSGKQIALVLTKYVLHMDRITELQYNQIQILHHYAGNFLEDYYFLSIIPYDEDFEYWKVIFLEEQKQRFLEKISERIKNKRREEYYQRLQEIEEKIEDFNKSVKEKFFEKYKSPYLNIENNK